MMPAVHWGSGGSEVRALGVGGFGCSRFGLFNKIWKYFTNYYINL